MLKTSRMSLLAATLLLAACGPELAPDGTVETEALAEHTDALKLQRTSRSTPAASWTLKSTDARPARLSPTWKTSFPIATTYEVLVASEVTGTLAGRHVLALELVMPSGIPYQRFDIPFVTDVKAGPGEQQAERTSTGWRVWASLPVAGTVIQDMGLSGPWTSKVWVDGAATPNATSSFDLY